MKLKKIVLITVFALIIIAVRFIMTHWLVFSYGTVIMYGPLPVLKLLPYECEEKQTAFPQWINNDEICYLELVLHYDDYSNEEPPSFLKLPVTDIYIYREKVNHPETKKLIKHIARQDVEPYLFSRGSPNKNLGLKIYNNGKNIFLYYAYGSCQQPKMYRCVTMNINGGNVKERIPEIIPFDISEDGRKLYGILEVNTLPDIYAIEEYTIKTGKIRKILDITDEKFRETRNAEIRNLKLVADDKLVLSYDKDYNTHGIAMYAYLIDLSNSKVEFIEDVDKIYDEAVARFDIVGDRAAILSPDRVYAMTKDKKYLISGNNCIYERQEDNWVKIKDFFKSNPIISPDGKKILYYDILTEENYRGSVSYLGEKLAVSDLKTIFEEQK